MYFSAWGFCIWYNSIVRSNTKQTGDIAEAKVLTRLLELGYNVLKPFGDNLPYDLVVDNNGKFIRIQVKGSHQKTGNVKAYQTRCKISGNWDNRYYSVNDFDFLVVFQFYRNCFYIVPIKDFVARGSFNFGREDHIGKNNQQYKNYCNNYFEKWDLLNDFSRDNVTVAGSLHASPVPCNSDPATNSFGMVN